MKYKHPLARSGLLAVGLLLWGLLIPSCQSAPTCTNGYSSINIDPFQSECSGHCDCNNQLYEGYCASTRCLSIQRAPCESPGRSEACPIQQMFRQNPSTPCTSGFRTCQEDGLNGLYWGNCVCPPQEPTPREPAPKPEASGHTNEAPQNEPSNDTDEPSSDTRNMDAPAEPIADADAGEAINDTQTGDSMRVEPPNDTFPDASPAEPAPDLPSKDTTPDAATPDPLPDAPAPEPSSPEVPDSLPPSSLLWARVLSLKNSSAGAQAGITAIVANPLAVYVTGFINGRIPLQSTPATDLKSCNSSQDAFILKTTSNPTQPQQTIQWDANHALLADLVSPERSFIHSLAPGTPLRLVGAFTGIAKLTPYNGSMTSPCNATTQTQRSMTSKGILNSFHAALDPHKLDWGNEKRVVEGAGITSALDIAVGISGNPHLTGYFAKNAKFSILSQEQTAAGGNDIFIAKEGTWPAITSIGGEGDDQGTSIALDDVEDIYITGFVSPDTTNPSIQFGPNASCTPTGGKNIFVAKFSGPNTSQGTSSTNKFEGLWVHCFPSTSTNLHTEIQVHSRSVYVTGFSEDAFSFKGKSYQGIFAAKFSTSGKFEWLKDTGAIQAESRGLAVDTKGNAFLTGHFSKTITFGTHKLTAPSGSTSAFFIAKIDAKGTWAWATSPLPSSTGDSWGRSLFVDKTHLYLAADLAGKINLGPPLLTVDSTSSSVRRTFFIAKYKLP